MKTIDSTDFITLFKLAKHVSRSLGLDVARNAIREKWLAGEIRFWVRWLPEEFYGAVPGVVASYRDEAAPPQFLLDLENRGIAFARVVGSEDGIYFEPRKTAYLFASRADAARFWAWDDQHGSKRITGRKLQLGAPPVYDWEKALIEASRFISENGLPKSQAVLVRYILEWFGELEPSESQVKLHIGPLYDAIRRTSSKVSKTSSSK
jgi:hypothetical protein